MQQYDFALCSALAEQGVSVTLFTSDQTSVPDGLAFPVELSFRGVFGGAPAWLRGFRYAEGLARVARHRSRDVPVLVHVHFFHALPLDYGFLAWMRARGCRIVVSTHDVRPFDVKGWGMHFVERIYRLADALIAHSNASRAELLTAGLDRDRVTMVPLGHYLPVVEQSRPDQRTARQHLGLPSGVPVILFFGQIKQVKGLDTLLHALDRLSEWLPDVRLAIAGSVWKDDWHRYGQLIGDLDLQSRTHIRLQHVPDAEVATYFAAADVVALPYRHVYQSAVLMLALSFGRPVVATRAGGLPEVVQDGETGYLVPADDPDALTTALHRVLSDREAGEAMGRRGRAYVEQQHSWTRIATLTRQVYERVLTQGVEIPRNP